MARAGRARSGDGGPRKLPRRERRDEPERRGVVPAARGGDPKAGRVIPFPQGGQRADREAAAGEDDGREPAPLQPDWKDVLALIIATFEVLGPFLLMLFGAAALVYLFLRLIAH
jgi:hypothetical protein